MGKVTNELTSIKIIYDKRQKNNFIIDNSYGNLDHILLMGI